VFLVEVEVRSIIGGAGEEGGVVFNGESEWCMRLKGDVLVGIGFEVGVTYTLSLAFISRPYPVEKYRHVRALIDCVPVLRSYTYVWEESAYSARGWSLRKERHDRVTTTLRFKRRRKIRHGGF
jgi:hypothetical protein